MVRVRSNKENAQFYAIEIFQQCKEDNNNFDVTNLKGIVLDWSNAERKRSKKAMGKETVERLMIGCLIHSSRSYQRVAKRVNSSLSLLKFVTLAKTHLLKKSLH